MERSGGLWHSSLFSAVLYLAALLPMPSNAIDSKSLEGTWKIASAQVALKPESGSIPFTKQGRELYRQNKRKQAKGAYDDYDHMTSRCASPGLPRLMLTNDRFRIWQHPGLVMFLFEWNRLFRQIDMRGQLKQPMTETVGESDEEIIGRAVPTAKGHWEGDILVANTEGFDESTLVDNLVPHGKKLKLTERIRLRDNDTLEDRITIEDPDYFTAAWDTVIVYNREPNDAFPENVCLDRRPAARPRS